MTELTGRARLALLSLAGMALAGCETLGARTALHKVEPAPWPPPVVHVQPPGRPAAGRSCVPRTLAPPPRYPDTDAALRNAPGAADRYQLMAAGRLMRQKRLEELEKVVAGCR